MIVNRKNRFGGDHAMFTIAIFLFGASFSYAKNCSEINKQFIEAEDDYRHFEQRGEDFELGGEKYITELQKAVSGYRWFIKNDTSCTFNQDEVCPCRIKPYYLKDTPIRAVAIQRLSKVLLRRTDKFENISRLRECEYLLKLLIDEYPQVLMGGFVNGTVPLGVHARISLTEVYTHRANIRKKKKGNDYKKICLELIDPKNTSAGNGKHAFYGWVRLVKYYSENGDYKRANEAQCKACSMIPLNTGGEDCDGCAKSSTSFNESRSVAR